MRRSLPALAALLSLLGSPNDLRAGQRDRPVALTRQASAAGSRIVGVVTDQAGSGIGGVSVLALGTTLAMVRSDNTGRFMIAVPAGEYVLRATRDGYISTYREAVRVHSDIPLRRNITLLRTETASSDPAMLTTDGGVGGAADSAPVVPGETTWRLRHLPRTVLRERSAAWWREAEASGSEAFGRDSLWLDAARPASSFRASSDLTGHVDFLTTSSRASSGAPTVADWPRGVAYVVLGAPVGHHGDWLVRAAMAAGGESAWTFVGEYRSQFDQRHAFRAGVSYSAQTLLADSFEHVSLAVPTDVRRVGAVYGSDRWTLGRGLDLGLGGRLDRVDYLAEPNLGSGSFDARQIVAPRTAVTLVVSRQMVAPGADQFQPPSSSGAWLPPERTFSALEAGRVLRPEAVQRYDVGVEATLRAAPRGATVPELVFRVRRFSEDTTNQITTLFGIDDQSQVGHYYISSPGSVQVDGWAFGVAGVLLPHVRGTVDYAVTRAAWTRDGGHGALVALARPAARQDFERGHDFTSSLEATLPSTDTTLTMAMRLNSRFSSPAVERASPGGRFAIEVRQALPFQPLGGRVLNLVVAARTLLSDLDQRGSFYDDLLTVAPPLRLTCGIQMRF